MQQKQPLTKAFIHKAGPFAKRGKKLRHLSGAERQRNASGSTQLVNVMRERIGGDIEGHLILSPEL